MSRNILLFASFILLAAVLLGACAPAGRGNIGAAEISDAERAKRAESFEEYQEAYQLESQLKFVVNLIGLICLSIATLGMGAGFLLLVITTQKRYKKNLAEGG